MIGLVNLTKIRFSLIVEVHEVVCAIAQFPITMDRLIVMYTGNQKTRIENHFTKYIPFRNHAQQLRNSSDIVVNSNSSLALCGGGGGGGLNLDFFVPHPIGYQTGLQKLLLFRNY
jgi:hypothetical protein